MAEAFYMRAKRVVSSGIEGSLDKLERASGTGLMRQAIREVDHAIDKVQIEQDAATDRKIQAASQQKSIALKIEEWGEKAAFTMEKGRDDLAEASIGRQMELEKQLSQFAEVETSSATEAEKLSESLIALKARRSEMDQELHEFEKAIRDSQLGGTEKADFERTIERKVEKAQQAFDRSMGLVSEGNGSGIDAEFAKQSADIDALQRDTEIQDRMAELKKSTKTKGKKAK